MLSYEKLSKKSKVFRAFTGFIVEEFNDLCTLIEGQYPKHEVKRLGKEDRKRAIGANRMFNI